MHSNVFIVHDHSVTQKNVIQGMNNCYHHQGEIFRKADYLHDLSKKINLYILLILIVSYKDGGIISTTKNNDLMCESISIYEYLRRNIINAELYITGDSSYGSSADDISALHVDGDVIVYFGTDLSCTSTTPVLIVPKQKLLVEPEILDRMKVCSVHAHPAKVLLLYDPSYHISLKDLIDNSHSNDLITFSSLPINADLNNWIPQISTQEMKSLVSLGGLMVDELLLNEINDINVWYIGNDVNQLTNISMRIPHIDIIQYDPATNEVSKAKGQDMRVFQERYGGLSKVKDATVIGLIVGSMGLSSELTTTIINKLSTLIEAANKKCIVIVVGRLSESKLWNFPEIDVYCLICNELTSMIKPKTFHVPVITPWELELGLGARDWESYYKVELSAVRDNVIDEEIIKRIKEFNEIDDEACDEVNMISEETIDRYDANTQLTVKNTESRIAFRKDDVLIDRFTAKTYKGLVPGISSTDPTTIQTGLFGTASGYHVHEHTEEIES